MRKNKGFTLIEILIALTILSIALMAMIKATSQNIKDTLYLQNKTIAMWVGTQVINECRAGLITLPPAPSELKKETLMLGRKWYWEANLVETPNVYIKQINVDVSSVNHAKLIHLESYLYAG